MTLLLLSLQRADHVLGVGDEYLSGIGRDVPPALIPYQIDELHQLAYRGRLVPPRGGLLGMGKDLVRRLSRG